MKKLLSVALVALLTTACFPCDLPSVPIVVAKQSATNQTSSIGSTTLITPSEDGDYVVQCYAVLGTTGGFDGDAAVAFSWTDEYRSNAATSVCDANGGAHFSSNQKVIHVASGNPISFSVTYGTGGGNTPYDVFITVVKE